MSTWVAALIAVAAVTVTYFTCIRPMRRGDGHCAGSGENPELDRQIAELREEVRVLRAQDSLDAGQVSGGKSAPPTDV
ncbi:hypothetical protein [Amycolatopsis tucumanensis]|uniref:Phage shock protein B n=1 Tax=Amycolatopsis tucumanensis TaxID=401106 RepID=A0ABP7JIJ3_9PSEU|nr:hypothetical protein [Amycolatopsis tucumanensis]MCF6425238.1 hypothetical protein [Amycolatopsis tucumanensis]